MAAFKLNMTEKLNFNKFVYDTPHKKLFPEPVNNNMDMIIEQHELEPELYIKPPTIVPNGSELALRSHTSYL
jgi:hypothetical protein